MLVETLPANLIRQWCYCPRVVYYQELFFTDFKRPIWVKQGQEFHKKESKLWQRRNLARFKLDTGQKHYQISMRSQTLRLHGIADMVIETEDAVYPVEYKLMANAKKRGDIMQLVAYAMLAEETFNKPASVGFIVGKGQALFQINCHQTHRQSVKQILQAIDQMLIKGAKPDSSASIHQCGLCEYLNHCNDRM